MATVLVGDERFVHPEGFSVVGEELAPILLVLGQTILLFDSDQESSLEIQQLIEVHEYVVDCITSNGSGNLSLELLKYFKVLNVITLSAEEFFNEMCFERDRNRCRNNSHLRFFMLEQETPFIQYVQDSIH